MSIGQRISELRKGFGYSQEYIAEKLNVSRQAVSKWEQDLSAPDTYNLIALAGLLGVSVEYLATGKKPEMPQESPNTAPPPGNYGSNTQKTVGLILLSAGLLALILGLLFSRVLLAVSILLLMFGTLMLTVRRHLGLVLLWVSVVIVFFGTTMLMPLKVVGETANSVTARPSFLPILLLLIIAAIACTAIKMFAMTHKKHRDKTDNDR